MDRSKRTPKQPKRFDDEAFEKANKSQPKQEPVKEVAKPPDAAPTKNIIKVKLARPRELFKAKEPKEIKKEPEEPKKEPKEVKIEPKEIKKEPKEIKKEPKEIKKEPKEIKKEPKEVKEKPIREGRPEGSRPPGRPPKIKGITKEKKELLRPKEFDIKLPDRDMQLVYRPKTKRPRTPPIYNDLIPNLVLPFWDARTAAEDHEDDNVKELVHCHCGVGEELGLMVQCETCLTWQHAHCLGIATPEDAPDGYTCGACSDPKFSRNSKRWAYDQEWLTKGRMKQFACDPNQKPEKNINTLDQINNLIGNVLNIHRIIHSLLVKKKILMNAADDDPELFKFKSSQPIPTTEVTPNDCRENLRLHIQQTEELISLELAQIEPLLEALEKECDSSKEFDTSLESLKNDLTTMQKYIAKCNQ